MDTVLAVVGTIGGIVSAGLGIKASKYLKSEASHTDRTLNWSLWWFAEQEKYENEGKKLCKLGALAFAVGAASWIAWYWVR